MVENSDFIRTSVCVVVASMYTGARLLEFISFFVVVSFLFVCFSSHHVWRVYILDQPQTSCVTLDKYLASLCLTSLTDKMWANNIISINCLLVSFGCITNNPKISMAYNLYIPFLSHGFCSQLKFCWVRSWSASLGWGCRSWVEFRLALCFFLILHGPAVFQVYLSHKESQAHRQASQVLQTH